MEATIRAVVTDVERVSPGFVRVALAVGDEWITAAAPDEFIHVEVGAATVDAGDGHTARHYTISRLVPGGFEIEVATHGHGPGAAWAESVLPGDDVAVSQPKAYYAAPDVSVERILIGDATALPAISRILAEASADERFSVVIELSSMADARDLPTLATSAVEWRLGGNGVGPSTLVDAAANALDACAAVGATPYLWVACESVISRRIRTLARAERGLPTSALRIVGYWHADQEKIMRVWNSLTDEQRLTYESVWRDDRTDEENWIEAEPLLRSLGV
jgi:NADPH-dependent ferric siderophore reductase